MGSRRSFAYIETETINQFMRLELQCIATGQWRLDINPPRMVTADFDHRRQDLATANLGNQRNTAAGNALSDSLYELRHTLRSPRLLSSASSRCLARQSLNYKSCRLEVAAARGKRAIDGWMDFFWTSAGAHCVSSAGVELEDGNRACARRGSGGGLSIRL